MGYRRWDDLGTKDQWRETKPVGFDKAVVLMGEMVADTA